ncbi:uridine kinase [Falsarthrobacter nasiphocae]|uniref:uridine kinase family protein n=1 Tax=Falsarthrobacter nasiphocae TaxID=189863 RepID=UPI0031D11C15
MLIGGASGSGKSYVARTHGRPHVELDNFYRDQAEHTPEHPLPVTPYGEIDWDHPGTWNEAAACASLARLAREGVTECPVYSISHSAATGTQTITCTRGPIAAEGLFASELLAPLRREGVDVEAYYIVEPAAWTALARFVRDVRESRKPLPFLLKRGWSLYKADGALRDRYAAAGFTLVAKSRLKRRLASM